MPDENTNESPDETEEKYPEVSVNDYTILPSTYNINSIYANGKKYKKVIAIGNIQVDEESYISTLVLTDEGILVPPFTLDGFVRVIERKTSWETNEPENKKKNLFPKFRKPKTAQKEVTDDDINKLIEKLDSK